MFAVICSIDLDSYQNDMKSEFSELILWLWVWRVFSWDSKIRLVMLFYSKVVFLISKSIKHFPVCWLFLCLKTMGTGKGRKIFKMQITVLTHGFSSSNFESLRTFKVYSLSTDLQKFQMASLHFLFFPDVSRS